MKQVTVAADGEAITVHIQLTFKKWGGRKLLVTPNGTAWAPRPRVDTAMVKALARAFRWRKMLDAGVYGTLEDLARAKGLAPSYVSAILRLTLLAPEIVETILDGRQPAELQLDDLLAGFPLAWEEQRASDRAFRDLNVDRRHKGHDGPLSVVGFGRAGARHVGKASAPSSR